MQNKALDKDLLEQMLTVLNDRSETSWEIENDSLSKTFVFASFREAFAFMTAMALYAEKVDHHPDWRNCYRQVDIRLTSFDIKALSQLDFDFAEQADLVAAGLPRN